MEVGVTPDCQRRGSESSSAAPASSRRPGTISETLYPLQLGKVAGQKVLQRQLTKGERCMCSHGCGQPKHSRSNCISKEVVVGSKFCQNCECIWKGCNSIRLWGEFCKNHKRTMADVGVTWQIVRAAGSLNSQLVPCDVDSFNSFYQLHPTWFLECVSVAFLKEPEAVKKFIDAVSGLGERTGVDRREYVRLAWRKVVIQTVRGGQDLLALQQVSRQGVGRFSCLARSATHLGIIEPVKLPPSLDAGEEVFQLGMTGLTYRFCSAEGFNKVYADYQPACDKWAEFLEKQADTGFNDYCGATKAVMDIAAKSSAAFGLKNHGYCFDFAVRKFIIAESSRRYLGMPLATSQGSVDPVPVEWGAVSIVHIRGVTADSGKHLQIFEPDVIADQASECMFGRTDWAVMLSCFACLWHEVKEKFVDTGKIGLDVLLEKLRSKDAADVVADWKKKYGLSPHPHSVAVALMGEGGGVQLPKRKRLHSIPQQPTRRLTSKTPLATRPDAWRYTLGVPFIEREMREAACAS